MALFYTYPFAASGRTQTPTIPSQQGGGTGVEALRAVTEKNSAVSTWDQAGKVQHRSSSLPFHTHGVLEGLRADGTTAPLVSLQPLYSHFFKSGVMLRTMCNVAK